MQARLDGDLRLGELTTQGVNGSAEVLELFLTALLHLVHELGDLGLGLRERVLVGFDQAHRQAIGGTRERAVLDGATSHDDDGRTQALGQPNVTATRVERTLARFGIGRAEEAARHVLAHRIERSDDDRVGLHTRLTMGVLPTGQVRRRGRES